MKNVSKNSFKKAVLTSLALNGAQSTSDLLASVKKLMGVTSYGREIYRGDTSRFDEKFYNSISNKSFFRDNKNRLLIEEFSAARRKKVFQITPQGKRELQKIF